MTIELVDDNNISSRGRERKYSDNELLKCLINFEREEGRPPKEEDFINNPKYPSFKTYQNRFGSWNSALQMAGLQAKKGGSKEYTEKELLECLINFEREEGRPPKEEDFINNPKYPNLATYQRRFGSWSGALKLVGLDTESIVRKGIIETNQQKARLAEIFVLEHFIEKVVDSSGENPRSPYDGICPKGETYDVKSSKLYGNHYQFNLRNTYREDIEWFYLLGFNKDYSNLEHAWRIPGNFTDEDGITIGTSNDYTYNLENMKEYEIIEKFKHRS